MNLREWDREKAVDALVLIIIFVFLLSYFTPRLLLSKTITTGGDTASHYYSAYFMKNSLLPAGRLVGWTQGNYAGFPMFQFYFFLPFLVMAVLGYLIPLQIAFKLVSVLGIFLLPAAAYYGMKAMKFRFPIPAFSAALMLPFLFMEANSMWGANIPSTLAGEFTYSISMALTLIFLGVLYREMEKSEGRRSTPLIALLVLITFTHVYTLLFVVITSTYFLAEQNRKKLAGNLAFLFKIYFTAFLLTSFWAIPMVAKLDYTTPFAVVWDIKNIYEVFPKNLLPIYLLSALGIVWGLWKKEDKILFITFSLVAAFFLYTVSTRLGIVDIRFIPFLQIYPLLVAAYILGTAASRLRGEWLLPVILVLATILWVNQSVTFIPNWIDWNYEGFEGKAVWPAFNGVNQYLAGGPGDPRVVYEHSQLHNSAGSSRAFESLPLFSGRDTLEGLYMQSTVSSPFIFYIQSEISQVTSCPFPQWPCTRFNPSDAARHLEIFNVGEVIARTDATKVALINHPGYEFEKEIGPYTVFRLTGNKGSYVEVPKYEPVLFETERWKESAYLWFINLSLLDVPLVFTDDASDPGPFKLVKTDGKLTDIPRVPIERNCTVSESVKDDEIVFTTNCVGVPHIVKVSYFPNWKVEGADKIYLVSPSFMLVIPSQEQVRIYYGKTFIDILGQILTLLGIMLLLFGRRIGPGLDEPLYTKIFEDVLGKIETHKKWIFIAAIVILLGLVLSHSAAQKEARLLDDRFGMELALATERYTVCDVRVKHPDLKEECFHDVAVATGDYNLCDVKIKTRELRDDCFKEIAVATGDLNLCQVKIESNTVKAECVEAIENMS
ncbi:MAG TPA: hypothetical protein ENH13_07475 [Euryarchaeota archaeon]|nr:hypothetical protein [Euryarchaeota archaeon]